MTPCSWTTSSAAPSTIPRQRPSDRPRHRLRPGHRSPRDLRHRRWRPSQASSSTTPRSTVPHRLPAPGRHPRHRRRRGLRSSPRMWPPRPSSPKAPPSRAPWRARRLPRPRHWQPRHRPPRAVPPPRPCSGSPRRPRRRPGRHPRQPPTCPRPVTRSQPASSTNSCPKSPSRRPHHRLRRHRRHRRASPPPRRHLNQHRERPRGSDSAPCVGCSPARRRTRRGRRAPRLARTVHPAPRGQAVRRRWASAPVTEPAGQSVTRTPAHFLTRTRKRCTDRQNSDRTFR
jgi:hypothetical protein